MTMQIAAAFCSSGGNAPSSRTSPHMGPQERSPSGGNRQAATARAASSAVLTIGTSTAHAPTSSARMIVALSVTGTRTIGARPAARMACSMPGRSLNVGTPCCRSTHT